MKVVFRVDASLQMGIGHIMRCLVLADAIRARGGDCQFICRSHSGNLIRNIRHRGYVVHAIPVEKIEFQQSAVDPSSHQIWNGASQEQDADECARILSRFHPNWLIVDHYGLDIRWEATFQRHPYKLMVIDDLMNRPHQCDVLLDQTYGRSASDYKEWVPSNCILLCGSRYVLLRSEFPLWRPYSLTRRVKPKLEQLLISMGGGDQANITGKVLRSLNNSELPAKSKIMVVMGPSTPYLDEVREQAAALRWPVDILVGVENMACLMANSDLAIGGGGIMSWERCCLGLPTIMLVVADNQRYVAETLEEAAAVQIASVDRATLRSVPDAITSLSGNLDRLTKMTLAAAKIIDESGTEPILRVLESSGGERG